MTTRAEDNEFTQIDEFMRKLESGCRHRWVVKGAVIIGQMKGGRMVFGTLSQCTECKDIMLGE